MMKKITFFSILLPLLFLLSPTFSFGQIAISVGSTADELVENIVGDGVEYSNATINGVNVMHGIFTNGGTTSLGIDGGIFLTSGSGFLIPGPNSSGSITANNGEPGDGVLSSLAGAATYDASVLEFDFIPESDTLRFKYSFGSDEYDEWVGSTYNDVFGFFVSGPNPDGGVYSDKNVAIVPGSNPELPVAINTINNGSSNNGPCSNCEFYFWNQGPNTTLEYDGFTVVLTAFIKVVPCEEYHIKMGVADAGDGIYDSGIFLQENSFESPKIDVEANPIPEGVADNMIEGCVEADIVFYLPNTSYAPITVDFTVEGSADEGDDYTPIGNSVTFEDGEDTTFIHVVPVVDNITEGEEDIIIIITNELGCQVRYDTVIFTITDYQDLETESLGEVSICDGQNTDIWVNTLYGIEPYYYEWSEGITDTVSPVNVAPTVTTTYYTTITDACGGSIDDTVTVNVFPVPEVDLGNDTTICEGEELVLDPGEGYESYIWNNFSTEQTLTVTESGTYWVQVMGEGGCSSTAQIVVDFAPAIDFDLGNDTILCTGETLLLEAIEDMASYLWNDGSTASTLEVTETGTYWVTVENDGGCAKTDTIQVTFELNSTTVDLGDDEILCDGEELVLDPGQYNGYEWQDGSTNQTFVVNESGQYWVEVLGGCGTASDTIVVTVLPPVVPDIGQDTSICYTQLPYTLDPGNYQSLLWQDGSTGPNFSVYETGTYSVSVVDLNDCEGSAEVFVRVGQEVSIDPETPLCEGDTITLSVSSDFDSFLWENENNETLGTENTIEIFAAGIYSITVGIDGMDCISSAQTNVVETARAVADLPEGVLCQGEELSLSVASDPSFTYSWSTGAETNEITVGEEGTYWVNVGNEQCGFFQDTVDVVVYPIPEVNIGEDYYLLEDESQEVFLDAGTGFISYVWQDGSSQSSYTVTYEEALNNNEFFVKIFDGKCYNIDQVTVEVINLEVPILITPNGDGINDFFLPGENWHGVKEHTIIVVNRWGQKVWESNDFPSGWDGTSLLGGTVPDGTYYWVLKANYGENLNKILKGSLTVVGSK